MDVGVQVQGRRKTGLWAALGEMEELDGLVVLEWKISFVCFHHCRDFGQPGFEGSEPSLSVLCRCVSDIAPILQEIGVINPEVDIAFLFNSGSCEITIHDQAVGVGSGTRNYTAGI